MKILIAVVQFKIERHKPEVNLTRIEDFVKKASAQKAHIIVFPEYFITGPVEEEIEYADTKGIYKKVLADYAEKHTIDIVAGSIVERIGEKSYNTSYYISAKGEILGMHRKKHLWHTEKGHFTPGNDITIADTSYGKVGILICWDMAFSDSWNIMLKQGVQIVFCPSYWSFGDAGDGIKYNSKAEVEFVNSMSVTRAFENETTVVFCNAAKNKQPKEYTPIGRSQITLPFIGPIRRLDDNEEEMFIQEIDTDILKVAEDSYHIREDSSGS